MTSHRTLYIAKRLGRNLQSARSSRGMRQADVAERMRIEPSQYARLERGEHESGVVKYLDAYWAIGMTPDEFFHRLEQRVP
ncbi:MAG: helix-turn-helix transcriptional regulator [Thermoleophilia bacterium]|nr:helix-turn-helix transcriptional regulator [Thermoleophilia bacterium]